MASFTVPPGCRLIFRATITVNGEKLKAADYGLRGFPIFVRRKK